MTAPSLRITMLEIKSLRLKTPRLKAWWLIALWMKALSWYDAVLLFASLTGRLCNDGNSTVSIMSTSNHNVSRNHVSGEYKSGSED